MQTFVLSKTFCVTARALDTQRLATQAKEAMMVHRGALPVLHPVHLMWKGSKPFLAWYGLCICGELKRRIGRDPEPLKYFLNAKQSFDCVPKWWANDDILFRVRVCHAANLRMKNDAYYKYLFQDLLPEEYWLQTPCMVKCRPVYWYPVEVSKSQAPINELWERFFEKVGI